MLCPIGVNSNIFKCIVGLFPGLKSIDAICAVYQGITVSNAFDRTWTSYRFMMKHFRQTLMLHVEPNQ